MMVDQTLDTLLEAVRELSNDARNNSLCPCREDDRHMESCLWNKYAEMTRKLDALIAQRKGKD